MLISVLIFSACILQSPNSSTPRIVDQIVERLRNIKPGTMEGEIFRVLSVPKAKVLQTYKEPNLLLNGNEMPSITLYDLGFDGRYVLACETAVPTDVISMTKDIGRLFMVSVKRRTLQDQLPFSYETIHPVWGDDSNNGDIPPRIHTLLRKLLQIKEGMRERDLPGFMQLSQKPRVFEKKYHEAECMETVLYDIGFGNEYVLSCTALCGSKGLKKATYEGCLISASICRLKRGPKNTSRYETLLPRWTGIL